MLKRIIYFIIYFIIFFFHFTVIKASIVVINGLSHTYKVENGQVYKGKIEIENTSSTPQSVKIFLQDFSYKADGSITYSDITTNKKSNGSWIKFNTNLLTLKGKEKTEVFYEITIPNTIKNPGSYWSVVIVEPVQDIKPSNDKMGVNITSIVRYAIQIITDYDADKAKPDLTFENIKVEKEGDKQTLKIAIANLGNLYSKTTASVEIYNYKTGEKIATLSSLAMSLLPDTSKLFYIDISKILPGKYKAIVMATDEEDNTFALNVELEVKND